jgi:hypothetical protein
MMGIQPPQGDPPMGAFPQAHTAGGLPPMQWHPQMASGLPPLHGLNPHMSGGLPPQSMARGMFGAMGGLRMFNDPGFHRYA